MSNPIYYITHENIKDKNILEDFIYSNNDLNYYFSDSFCADFYIDLALAGFISVWYKEDDTQFILPEIQFEYAVLDFQDLHISKKVKKLLKKGDKDYSFIVDDRFDDILENLKSYHENSWIKGKYIELLKDLDKDSHKTDKFKLSYAAVVCNNTKKIIAGEIGYITHNSIYTSLTGFCSKDKAYNNYGTLQLVLLAKYLEKENFSFWNLGHPHMEYKLKLGAKVLNRREFLDRFLK